MPDRPQPSWTTPARIVRVVDGDTVDVEVTRKLRIRLLDCWAAETHKTAIEGEKAVGLKAKEALEKLVAEKGSDVTLQIPTSGNQTFAEVVTMGRLLGRLWTTDGREVSETMRRKGFAEKTKEKLHEQLGFSE